MHEGATQPTRYRVHIGGRVGHELTDTFDLDTLELETRLGETTLTGTFADQAQLYGLLDRLQDLGIPIVSVNPVE